MKSVSYSLIVEHKEDIKNNTFRKTGTLITGYLRSEEYPPYILTCLQNPCPESISWGNDKEGITKYNDIIKATPIIIDRKTVFKLLTLIFPSHSLTDIEKRQKEIRKRINTRPNRKIKNGNMLELNKNQAYKNQIMLDFAPSAAKILNKYNKHVNEKLRGYKDTNN